MEKLFTIPFNSGSGIYQIIGNFHFIIKIDYIDDDTSVINNDETLLKIYSYPVHLTQCFQEFSDYFKGKLKIFQTAKFLKFEGTDFQIKVWRKMLEVPYGETISYSDLAKLVDSPKAFRSIGTICKKNPFAIIVPCHRIVGKDSIGGFRSGIKKKNFLLNLEKNKLIISLKL